jgi:hypothetical protein
MLPELASLLSLLEKYVFLHLIASWNYERLSGIQNPIE